VGLETVTTVLEELSTHDMSMLTSHSSVNRKAHTSAPGAADFAGENRFLRSLVFLLPRARIEQVAAVQTEDEGADG
jgi:hypothetical protein